MPIRAFLNNQSFGPDEIKVLVTAFEEALQGRSALEWRPGQAGRP